MNNTIDIVAGVNAAAAAAVKHYRHLEAERDRTWRALLAVDQRRKGWRELRETRMDAHIEAEKAVEQYLIDLGLAKD